MSQLGRISGGVLKDNLERQGINLNFKNTVSDTAVLHLDVVNNKIGINTESPSDVLTIPTQLGSTNLIADYANIANFELLDSEINLLSGDMLLSSNDYIFATAIATTDLNFNNNTISTYTPNTSIELRPNGSGDVNIRANTNVTGNIHATGDITFGGNFVVGDENTDSIIFEAEITSDIIPEITNTSRLGSPTKKWLNLYARNLIANTQNVDSFVINDTELSRRQGNIFYVSENGNDNNVGDHQHGPFRTIKHALSVADASSFGPVVIHIFPGEYREEFPLTVPQRVTIQGEDLRNTIVKPTLVTRFNDAFLLQEGSVVENITIKDFNYSSVNNTGHAFRFVPNGIVENRSPYIRNVTVITSGTTVTLDDPRGFASGNAGRGAYIDGSDLNEISTTASMLFHSVTFITPGVDCITMTNGVRVEWLNSFIYFANIGLHAVEGITGRRLDDSTVIYGAEVRAIGSACVYGNIGAQADGISTLMYLISHNFAYIGSGKDTSNDTFLNNVNAETIEINFGKIYYTSTDATGTYRVGDSFYVDFTTGNTSISGNDIDLSSVNSLIINDGSSVTYIDGERIDLGNLRVSGNTISTTEVDLILSSFSKTVNVNSNPGFVIANGREIDNTETIGGLRYNTTTNLFEGYSTANTSLSGIYSDDRLTNLVATNFSNELVLTINDIVVGNINSTGLNVHGIKTNDILFDNNLITSTQIDSNIILERINSADVSIFDLTVNNSSITNTSSNAFTINNTNRGYAKFNATTGLVIPVGTTAQRPDFPEIGDTRWNIDLEFLETYNGTEWQQSINSGPDVTVEMFEDLMDIYTLVLG